MARKCDTSKYRKRVARQRQNRGERKRRLQLEQIQYLKRREEAEARAKAAREADPRWQLAQRLVNILYARLCASPLYRTIETARLFGVDAEALLKETISGAIREENG